jgi:hypothetical protein
MGEHGLYSMAYDSVRRRTVLAGFNYGFPPSADVFEWRYFADDPMCLLGPPL